MRSAGSLAASRVHEEIPRDRNRSDRAGLSGQRRRLQGQRQQHHVQGWPKVVCRWIESGSAGKSGKALEPAGRRITLRAGPSGRRPDGLEVIRFPTTSETALTLATIYSILQPSCRWPKPGGLGMDTSVCGLDLSAWLWTSNILYVASLCLALIVVLLVGCVVGQSVTDVAHSDAPKRRTHISSLVPNPPRSSPPNRALAAGL